MAIVYRPDENLPLSQGDILKNVPIVVASASGGLVAKAQAVFALVVSRPCKALRDDFITVAPIVVWKLDLKVALPAKTESVGASLNRMRRLLSGVRDGGELSDSFYLGNLYGSGSNDRHAAQLTTLSTVEVPSDGSAADGGTERK